MPLVKEEEKIEQPIEVKQPKPKRVMTEAQLQNLAKAREAKKAKANLIDKKIQQAVSLDIKPVEKPTEKPDKRLRKFFNSYIRRLTLALATWKLTGTILYTTFTFDAHL